METTILYAHPWDGSFNHAILENLIEQLCEKSMSYNIIDLYEDGFNPVMSKEDLASYNEGISSDPLVNKYISILEKTDQLLIIFPIWWYDAPAILRGFLDKVLLKNRAYKDGQIRLEPLLHISRTILITTSGVPSDTLVNEFGNSIVNTFIGGTLKSVGMGNAEWLNCGMVHTITDEQRKEFLASLNKLVF